MAAYTDYMTPTGKVVVKGEAPIKVNRKVITAANVIPGRLAMRDTSDGGIKVADATKPVLGWVGYEDAEELSRPVDMATAYAVNKEVPILSGKGFSIRAWMLAGTYVEQGDLMASFTAGTVVPAEYIEGRLYLKYPFVKKASGYSTYFIMPAGCTVSDVSVRVSTGAGSSWIDVGLASGTTDGFLRHESCVSTGIIPHECAVTTTATETVGAYLQEVEGLDSTAVTPNYWTIYTKPAYVVGATYQTLYYTTSNHTVIGDILIQVSGPGINVVGQAVATVDNSAGIVPIACTVKSEI